MLGSRARTFITMAVVTVAALGCFSDMGPTAISTPDVPRTSGSLLGTTTSLLNGLLACRPQPYAADTVTVGPAGGTIEMGAQRLVIPAGALNQTVQIIGEAPSDNVVSVRFQPEGLKFNPARPPRLTLDYSACGLVRNLLPKRIAYTDDRLDILSLLPSLDDLFRRRVSANIYHFSRYAVAW